MLRVGLTGELGSGKSTVLKRFAELGAVTMSSDEMGRDLMQPGQRVYAEVVRQFGSEVVLPNGLLDRAALARIAFDRDRPRVEELNSLVHPAVLAEQERRLAGIARTQPRAIVVIESALIFSARSAGDQPWRTRFDRLVLVTAPDAVKIRRFVDRIRAGRVLSPEERGGLEADAWARLHAQCSSFPIPANCRTINNDGDLSAVLRQTDEVYRQLQKDLEGEV